MSGLKTNKNFWVALLMVTVSCGALAEDGCVTCHQSEEFFTRYPKLDRYYKDWLYSPHAAAEVLCADCHGGDPSAETMEAAHQGVLPMNDTGSTLYYQNQPETCGECHRSKHNQFVKSKHFEALMDKKTAPTCTTCHPAMNRRPDFRAIVLNACRNCHYKDNDRGLPLIGDQAETAFQQLNIAGGFLGWVQLHFESHQWPNESESKVRDLERRYSEIVNRIHRFDLNDTEQAVGDLLADLRQIFEAERKPVAKD